MIQFDYEDENKDEEEKHNRSYGSGREIEIRAAHEIMAARTTQLALLVDQFVPALQAEPPVLAGNIFSGDGTGIPTKIISRI